MTKSVDQILAERQATIKKTKEVTRKELTRKVKAQNAIAETINILTPKLRAYCTDNKLQFKDDGTLYKKHLEALRSIIAYCTPKALHSVYIEANGSSVTLNANYQCYYQHGAQHGEPSGQSSVRDYTYILDGGQFNSAPTVAVNGYERKTHTVAQVERAIIRREVIAKQVQALAAESQELQHAFGIERSSHRIQL